MQLASRLLVEEGAKVGSVAAAVGFETKLRSVALSRDALASLQMNGADEGEDRQIMTQKGRRRHFRF